MRFQFADHLSKVGLAEDAIVQYRDVIKIKPEFTEAHNNLGLEYVTLNKWQDAAMHFRSAIRIRPKWAEAHLNLGALLLKRDDLDGVEAQFLHALRIQPDFAGAQNNLGIALQNIGRIEEAIAHYQDALRIRPDYAEVHNWLGTALLAIGRFNEAVRHSPQNVVAVNNFAWLLATCPLADVRDGKRALKLAERLAEWQGPDRFPVLDTLAAAHAEQGQFDQAVEWQEKTVQLAPAQQQDELRERLEMYRQGKPFRETPNKHAEKQ